MDVEKKIEAKVIVYLECFQTFLRARDKQKTLKIHRKTPVLESVFKTASDMRKKEREQQRIVLFKNDTPSFGQNLINSVYLISFNLCDEDKKLIRKHSKLGDMR